MKNLIFILSAFIILSAASCKKNNGLAPATTGATAVKKPVSGYTPTTTIYFAGTDGATAVYWKNGAEYSLPISGVNGNGFGAVTAFTYNMAVADTDVYITGYNGLNFVYWKNGVSNNMPLSLYAQGVASSGTDIYFAGTCYNDNPQYNLALLKNGTYSALPRGGLAAYIYATTIAGTDVYCSGTDNTPGNTGNTVPVYWKNGTEYFLPITSSAGNGTAMVVSVYGTDVYFAGVDGQTPVYWKNGIEHVLPTTPNPSGVPVGSVTAMAMSGADMYFAGEDFRNGVYWKNGTETILPLKSSSSTGSSTAGIAVDDQDVYIAGNEANFNWSNGASSASIAEYWKNGTAYSLPVMNSGSGYVAAIVIVSK